MINRVLIRIKVVQLLYSYLLNRSDFKIAQPPTENSRDSRYAYSLYLDLLLLVIELSGLDLSAGKVGRTSGLGCDPRLSSNKLVKALLQNDQILNLVTRDTSGVARFNSILPSLRDKIESSAIFNDYKKRKDISIKDDAQLWNVLIRTVLERDTDLLKIASETEGFTNRGYARAFEMAADTINSFTENRTSAIEARNALDRSFNKAYELYHLLLWLCVEITDMQALRLDNAKHKFLPTPDDLNTDMKFVNNGFVAALRENEDMKNYLEDNPVNWTDNDDVMVRHLLDKILESDIYASYMADPTTSYEQDCDFWRKVYRKIILPSDELAETLESRSIYWNDDLDIMGTFVLKTIKRFAVSETHQIKLLPKFNNDIDERFGPELFNDAISNYDKYHSYVERFTSKDWDIERVAFIDVVILVVAIAELIGFPQIPVPVTVNEYVEIANTYSTHKSGQFVNGMLSTIIKELHEEGIINK